MKRIFSYYGGKASHLGFIFSYLPKAKVFVDVFGGSGVVALNFLRAERRVYNEIDEEVFNFFKVCKEGDWEELLRIVSLTPYSKVEYEYAQTGGEESAEERARKFLVKVAMRWGNIYYQKGWARGMSKVRAWEKMPVRIEECLKSIRGMEIENLDFEEVIGKYDGKSTLFYCDPPYVDSARLSEKDYRFDFVQSDHRRLASVLKGVSGRVVLSGYESELYEELFPSWRKVFNKSKPIPVSSNKVIKKEVLWLNF